MHLAKNALWVAIATTLAAICLYTAIIQRETQKNLDVDKVRDAVLEFAKTARERVEEQEDASQRFVNKLGRDIGRLHDKAEAFCELVVDRFEGGDGDGDGDPGQGDPGQGK